MPGETARSSPTRKPWNNLAALRFLTSKETPMLRFLIRIGAIYAAFQIGREFGRKETEVVLLPPPVDYERHPTSRNETEFGET
ncbi:hypothetical protein X736_04595 [Mesorhizobium sp. L2C089B000]|nr:hypothetical protein X736_04595 [Mesorhizobium sp. L2C089B000]